MITRWKGKNPIYFGVITIIPFDNLYRRTYYSTYNIIYTKYIPQQHILYNIKKQEMRTSQNMSVYINYQTV
jgi:hypothetical protein